MINNVQTQLPLSLELYILGNPCLLSPLAILRPTLRQIQAPAQNGVSLLAHMVHAHGNLAVAYFAQSPGILPLHSHRMSPLLGKAGIVDHPHRVRL